MASLVMAATLAQLVLAPSAATISGVTWPSTHSTSSLTTCAKTLARERERQPVLGVMRGILGGVERGSHARGFLDD